MLAGVYSRVPSKRVAIVSRKVFCGANNPLRAGIKRRLCFIGRVGPTTLFHSRYDKSTLIAAAAAVVVVPHLPRTYTDRSVGGRLSVGAVTR